MSKAEWLSYVPHAAVTIFVLLVALSDWRARRIPNVYVFPAIVLGLALHATRGWNGLEFSLKGLGLGFALLILPYVFGGMKAGDVKFLAAIGAWVGATDVLRALLMTVLLYPLLAIVPVLRAGKLKITLLRFGRVFFNFLGFFLPGFKLYAQQLESRDDKSIASVQTPFGVAIAAGTLLALFTNWLR